MKSALTAAVLVFTANPAFTADLYADTTGFTWSGLYAGIHFGYSTGNSDLLIGPETGSFDPTGFIGGVQVGVNHQLASRLVIGAEADVSYNSVDDVAWVAGSALLESKVDWSGSARMRLAYAFHRSLPYITAGVAAGSFALTATDPASSISYRLHDETHIGWTAGAGVEHAFAERWSARLEYRYSDFGKEDVSLAAALGVDADVDLSMHDLRVGLNYKF